MGYPMMTEMINMLYPVVPRNGWCFNHRRVRWVICLELGNSCQMHSCQSHPKPSKAHNIWLSGIVRFFKGGKYRGTILQLSPILGVPLMLGSGILRMA